MDQLSLEEKLRPTKIARILGKLDANVEGHHYDYGQDDGTAEGATAGVGDQY